MIINYYYITITITTTIAIIGLMASYFEDPS